MFGLAFILAWQTFLSVRDDARRLLWRRVNYCTHGRYILLNHKLAVIDNRSTPTKHHWLVILLVMFFVCAVVLSSARTPYLCYPNREMRWGLSFLGAGNRAKMPPSRSPMYCRLIDYLTIRPPGGCLGEENFQLIKPAIFLHFRQDVSRN
jgi:hypothetical protein